MFRTLTFVVTVAFALVSRSSSAQHVSCATRGDSLRVVKDEILRGGDAGRRIAARRWRSELGCIDWNSEKSTQLAQLFETRRKSSEVAFVIGTLPIVYLVGADIIGSRPRTSTVVAAGLTSIAGVTIGRILWGQARRARNDAIARHNEVIAATVHGSAVSSETLQNHAPLVEFRMVSDEPLAGLTMQLYEGDTL